MKTGDCFTHQFIVDERIYQGYIDLFGDKNPMHVDHDRASEKGFQTVVMHGNILGGFLSYFIGECLPVKNILIHSQELWFYKPVYLNVPMLFTAEVKDVFESVNAVLFGFRFSDKNGTKLAKGNIQIILL